MKKPIYFIIVFLSYLLFSCDKIEGPYMVHEIIDASCDTPQFPSLGNTYKKLLLEEFTGHTCVNCPEGHQKASQLIDKYQDSIVVVAIHAGVFAQPELPDFPADYRTAEGTEMNDAFGVQGYPSGMVNRLPFGGSIVMGKTSWGMACNAINKQDAKVSIQMISDFNNSEQKSCVHTKVTFLEDIQANLKLSIYMIEDSIISPQKNSNQTIGDVPTIHNYCHKHMLRASLNSVWGVDVPNNITTAQQTFYKGYSFLFQGTQFNPNHCSFIAIVYDKNTYEVLQVEEIKAIEGD